MEKYSYGEMEHSQVQLCKNKADEQRDRLCLKTPTFFASYSDSTHPHVESVSNATGDSIKKFQKHTSLSMLECGIEPVLSCATGLTDQPYQTVVGCNAERNIFYVLHRAADDILSATTVQRPASLCTVL
jgi:hypothetical protein